ncbi:hypothetical protein [Chengkuizengella sediminis]|uniref:hypothetical protein n=1 Tax=Chengkuizengella sediminis TaxID=1885917 RepID=UPI0013898197|nr:hypothetical protein [Chengkuizengella sediminis]NDI35336.1 hypothetical protein [Chengkuizengella sediminis]
MGVFDENLCDCCVCPMECVLKELVGVSAQQILIIPNTVDEFVFQEISDVKDFLLFSTDQVLPISNILSIRFLDNDISVIDNIENRIKLKPIKKSNGECSCIENKTTNFLKTMIGKDIQRITPGFNLPGTIIDVGKGIVVARGNPDNRVLSIISTCRISRILL